MIKRATLGREITVGVVNEVGALANITSFLVNHGINIEAVAGSSAPVGEMAALMFITDNNNLAVNALQKSGYEDLAENNVIIVEVENKPGALKNISERLAQSGLNITYIYATTCGGGCPTKVVLSTPDNEMAFRVLTEQY